MDMTTLGAERVRDEVILVGPVRDVVGNGVT